MPAFDTPQPISADFDLSVSHVRLIASKRADTVVTVQPADPAKKTDVTAAAQARVEYANGRLSISAARKWRPGDPGSLDITVELPAGSRIDGRTGMGDFVTEGTLGACKLKTGLGNVRIEHSGALQVRSGTGRVSAGQVDGDADISAAGDVNAGTITGPAVIKNANGNISIDDVGGDLRVSLANGSVSIGCAGGSVNAKTANGDLRVGGLSRGSAVLETAVGELEIGVSEGTAAWLDVRSHTGRVRNTLSGAESPKAAEQTVEVRARTYAGDILIHRA